MIYTILFIIVFTITVCVILQYRLLIPSKSGLRILMYHKVQPGLLTRSSITPQKLEEHFRYIKSIGYTCLNFRDIIFDGQKKLPPKSLILTFDDGYFNNLAYLYPLLVKYNLHATIMLPVGYIGKVNEWDAGDEKIMGFDELKSLDSKYISYGLHTYYHIDLRKTELKEIQKDLDKCKDILTKNQVEFLPILAYPYGAYPRKPEDKNALFKLLRNSDIKIGLRIGNNINKLPLKSLYEVKRIDIRGTDSHWEFRTKIQKGRVKLF